MVLTKEELINSLKNEVRILLHLADKVQPSMVDYRPTAKQRSTIELLRYMSMMGPQLVKATQAGAFDPQAWSAVEKSTAPLDLAGVKESIASHTDQYASLIGGMSEDDLRSSVTMFGQTMSKGAFIANNVLGGHAAYRTQLFLYLKSCGREELNTMNLWGGMDS